MCNINVLYLDKNDIQYPNTDERVQVHGTLKVHQVKRINGQSIEFFFNSQYTVLRIEEELNRLFINQDKFRPFEKITQTAMFTGL